MQKVSNKTIMVFSLLVSAFLLMHCENEDGTVVGLEEITGESEVIGSGSVGSTVAVSDYFIVTHPDFRKCMWPMCGGSFVERVNTSVARCATGRWNAECHALEFDLSALGLTATQEAKVLDIIESGGALVRGELEKQDVGSSILGDVLVASEVWVGVTGSTPSGHTSRVDDTGAICITYPCPIYEERSLNSDLEDDLADLDLTSTGASASQIAQALSELDATGLLVVGNHSTMTGPAGSMNTLEATEFYRRLSTLSAVPSI